MMQAIRRGLLRSAAHQLARSSTRLQLAKPVASNAFAARFGQSLNFSSEASAGITDSDFARYSDATLNDILEMMDGIEAILPDADITLSVC